MEVYDIDGKKRELLQVNALNKDDLMNLRDSHKTSIRLSISHVSKYQMTPYSF